MKFNNNIYLSMSDIKKDIEICANSLQFAIQTTKNLNNIDFNLLLYNLNLFVKKLNKLQVFIKLLPYLPDSKTFKYNKISNKINSLNKRFFSYMNYLSESNINIPEPYKINLKKFITKHINIKHIKTNKYQNLHAKLSNLSLTTSNKLKLKYYKNKCAKLLILSKKEALKLSVLNNFATPLDMSISQSSFDYRILSNLFGSITQNKHIFNKQSPTANLNYPVYSLSEIKNIILSAFKNFDEEFANIVMDIFDNNYILFSNNPNIQFHCQIIDLRKSRIVVYYDGSIKNLFNIAHELGHSIHSYYVMKSNEPIFCDIPLPHLEIGSMFCEIVLFYYLLEHHEIIDTQLLLHYFMNYLSEATIGIYARFLLEDKIFSLVSNINNFKEITNSNYLDTLCYEIQKKAYCNSNNITKSLWFYKTHFYSVSNVYYNYPYAFGILIAFTLYLSLLNNEIVKEDIKLLFCNTTTHTTSSLLTNINISPFDINTFNKVFEELKRIIDN